MEHPFPNRRGWGWPGQTFGKGPFRKPGSSRDAFLRHGIQVWWASIAIALTSFSHGQPATSTNSRSPAEDIASLERNGKREAWPVHDPSTLVKCKDEYWFFATGPGVSSWRSKDLLRWERGPRVFMTPPIWTTNVTPRHRGYFWAPDVIHLGERYLVYYSVSQFGVNTSAIGLASNSTLDPADPHFRWIDQGIVIETQKTNDFNAIDPQVIQTPTGELWMAFGSFWSGIKLVQLNPRSGQRLRDSPIHSLAYEKEIEAAAIHHHDGYFYLFANWGKCCRGVDSTYEIRIGRSRAITGPYLDKDGVDLMKKGGTLLLATDGAFIGPGHAGVFEERGKFWFSCHFYDATQRGRSTMAIRPLRWAADGWPVLDDINQNDKAPAAALQRPDSK